MSVQPMTLQSHSVNFKFTIAPTVNMNGKEGNLLPSSVPTKCTLRLEYSEKPWERNRHHEIAKLERKDDGV